MMGAIINGLGAFDDKLAHGIIHDIASGGELLGGVVTRHHNAR